MHTVGYARQGTGPQTGQVTVQGTQLLRDGRPWIPHGYYQIAFEVAPADLSKTEKPFWANAYRHYSPAEYQAMRAAGADSVRIQIAQAGADRQSPEYDQGFVDKAVQAVRAARAAGLTVILSDQDESHVANDQPIALPDAGTQRVWQELAPKFRDDRGVAFELLNEPRPLPSAQNWSNWATAMNATIHTVRAAGAPNVVIADGLAVGHVIDGAPLLADPQVAYASHPYALPLPAKGTPTQIWDGEKGQTIAAWKAQFGNFAAHAPVIITEWIPGSYFCNADTPRSTVNFLQYLQQLHIGLEAGVWDWSPGGFGSARWDFPQTRVSKFTGLKCHQNGYGFGTMINTWYATGTPPQSPQ